MRTADKFASIMGITSRHADHLGKGARKASPKLAKKAYDLIGLDPLLLFFPEKRRRSLWVDVEECLAQLPNHSPTRPSTGLRPDEAA